jgi:hypothetical protein
MAAQIGFDDGMVITSYERSRRLPGQIEVAEPRQNCRI